MNPSRESLRAGADRKLLNGALRGGVLSLAVMLITACGGGASTESNPVTGTTGDGGVGASSYDGPNAQTDDIREFQVNVWEDLRSSSKCGACHNTEVGQAPMFVRFDDVNLAYAAATPLVDLDSPASSRLVTKVGGGHNCWLPSDAACAQSVTAMIEAWASGVQGGGRSIQLTAPNAYAPGATRSFPADSSIFMASALWTTLKTNCQSCHSENAAIAQSPFFASDDVDTAYDAVKSKIDLNDDVNDPERSRLIVRLRSEFHNCWTSSCTDDAQDMEDDILALIAAIDAGNPNAGINPDLVISNAVNIVNDGVVASGGNRYEANVIALYEFKTGSGNIALDSSGVGDALNLEITPDPDDPNQPDGVEWVGGWGLRFIDGKAQGSTEFSKKLHDLIKATGEYSIEAWVAPANVTQEGPARIVSYSGGTDVRNFTLGQTQYNYDFLHRSSTTDANGEPALSTADADEDLQATLQHVVVNFDPVNGRSVYVNGQFTDDMDSAPAGNLNDWDDSFALVIGNEASNNRQWQGTIRLLAIHNRVLTPEQIQQNFDVGVGQKFFMLFGIGHVDGVPDDSYIMFDVEQYDSYSYLFNNPMFINLDGTVVPSDIALEGMRIGLNGKEVAVGQAYQNLMLNIGTNYDPATGERLSDLGTIIGLENGQDSDEFFLTFEHLGNESNPFDEVSPMGPPPVPTPLETAEIGVRTFDEINATMAAMTGVSEQAVRPQFDTLRQQLPAVETAEGFLSAHQMGVAQLAIAYCDNLVEDAGARSAFFTRGFNFNADVYAAFAGNKQVDVIDDLYDRMIGIPRGATDLIEVPTRADVQQELNNPVDGPDLDVTLDPPLPATPDGLYDRLRFAACNESPDPVPVPAACDAVRTRAIVKALCASTLASGAMLVQ